MYWIYPDFTGFQWISHPFFLTFGADEIFGPFALVQKLLWWHAKELDDAGELVALVLSGQEGVAGQELGQDAAQAPHVDGHAVPGTQDDLRGPVEP